MPATVEIPTWLVGVALILAGITLLNHFLLPAVRWFLRRRVNRVIDEVNTRLKLELPRFQLTKREVLIDRLTYDPEIIAAVEIAARERDTTRDAIMAEVVTYAREMVPAFNAYFYFRIGYWLARKFVRMFYWVRLGYADEIVLGEIPPNTAVVFFMNHRFNMDYMLVSYLAARSAALSYGAGEWARVWPLRSILRSAGAYIVRRGADNPLYRKILERYVQMATESCVPHAVFAEGRLSRDGKVHNPKLGLLGYITKTFDSDGSFDILFIPVGINFDRVMEERTLVANEDTDFRGRGSRFVLGSSARYLLTQIWRRLTGQWVGYGVACASFGKPISLKEWARRNRVNFAKLDQDKRFKMVERLGLDLSRELAAVIPVLAVPLVSTVLINAKMPLGRMDILSQAHDLLLAMKQRGAHIALREENEVTALENGLLLLKGRDLLLEDEAGLLSIQPQEVPLLTYYANSVGHLRPGRKWTPSDA